MARSWHGHNAPFFEIIEDNQAVIIRGNIFSRTLSGRFRRHLVCVVVWVKEERGGIMEGRLMSFFLLIN